MTGPRRLLLRALTRLATTRSVVHELPVTVVNMRSAISTAQVLQRLGLALDLIARYTPHYYRHLRRDFAGIVVQRHACRGAYYSDTRTCLIELTFVVDPAYSLTQVAAVVVHEAMHARLDRLGFPYDVATRARHERFCRRAEVRFGQLVPDGAAVAERALDIARGADDEVAVDVDPAVAAQRVLEADLRASPTPLWLRRWIARRRGITID